MEYLNEDMDDLFRKAGEQYPLKTSDSDWDAVLGRLQPQAENEFQAAQGSADKKKRRNRRFFWLLLLLPLGLFSLRYFGGTAEKNKTLAPVTPSPVISQKDSALPGTRHARTDLLPAGQTALPSARQTTNSNPEEKTNGVGNLPRTVHSGDPKTLPSNRLTVKDDLAPNVYAFSEKNKRGRNRSRNAGQQKMKTSISGATPDQEPVNTETENQQTGTATALPEVKEPSKAKDQKQTGKPAQDTSTSNSKRLATSAQPANSRDTAKKNTATDNKKLPAKKSGSKEKGIYLSLVGGPDLSTVKFQSVKKTGFSIGLLAGYRFNKHISAETGLFWDRKQYYSEGKYFNKSKTSIPQNVRIMDLDGNCDMFEIPIHVRYDFSFTRKGRFFSTAGFSTYIMKKENYDYSAEAYGTYWSRNVSYPNSGNNIFSILQLSAGYEYQLGKIGRIRIEPYFKIPLSGVGIGSLPISSAGLYLGITHPFR